MEVCQAEILGEINQLKCLLLDDKAIETWSDSSISMFICKLWVFVVVVGLDFCLFLFFA